MSLHLSKCHIIGNHMPWFIYYSQFLVLHFSENFMNIRTKIAKLQMHENLHKNVNENMFSFLYNFYEGQLKQQICSPPFF